MTADTAQKVKFSITDFFSKCDQIRSSRFDHIYLRNPSWKTLVFVQFHKKYNQNNNVDK